MVQQARPNMTPTEFEPDDHKRQSDTHTRLKREQFVETCAPMLLVFVGTCFEKAFPEEMLAQNLAALRRNDPLLLAVRRKDLADNACGLQ
jgi:hypothetical protein